MGFCGSVCKYAVLPLVAILVATIVFSAGVLPFIPAVRGPFNYYVNLYCPDALFTVPFTLNVIKCLVLAIREGGDTGTHVKNCFADDMQQAYGGGGTGYGRFVLNTGPIPCAFAHHSLRKILYNPHTKVPKDRFLGSTVSELPAGVLPGDVSPSLLELDNDDPALYTRKDLMGKVFGLQTKLGSAAAPFETPAWLSKEVQEGGYSEERVFHVVGYNLYKRLYGIKLSQEDLMEHYEYLDGLILAVAGKFPKTEHGRETASRMDAIRIKLQAKLMQMPITKTFVTEAKKLGEDAMTRLREFNFITSFAGYHGTGTLTKNCMHVIQKDPEKMIPLFEKDNEAFMHEVIRLYPPVGGMLSLTEGDVTLGNGRTLLGAGQMVFALSNGANRDEQVFENPKEFNPSRPNVKRHLSFNAEFAGIEECTSAAGCASAPRPCPGAQFAISLATDAVKWWLSVGGAKDRETKKEEL